MRTCGIKHFTVGLVGLLILSGCALQTASRIDSFRVETVPGSELAFRRITVREADDGVVVAGRVDYLSTLPRVDSRILVSLKDEDGNLIEQKTASWFPRPVAGRAQPPESRFAVRFSEIPSERFVIGIESIK